MNRIHRFLAVLTGLACALWQSAPPHPPLSHRCRHPAAGPESPRCRRPRPHRHRRRHARLADHADRARYRIVRGSRCRAPRPGTDSTAPRFGDGRMRRTRIGGETRGPRKPPAAATQTLGERPATAAPCVPQSAAACRATHTRVSNSTACRGSASEARSAASCKIGCAAAIRPTSRSRLPLTANIRDRRTGWSAPGMGSVRRRARSRPPGERSRRSLGQPCGSAFCTARQLRRVDPGGGGRQRRALACRQACGYIQCSGGGVIRACRGRHQLPGAERSASWPAAARPPLVDGRIRPPRQRGGRVRRSRPHRVVSLSPPSRRARAAQLFGCQLLQRERVTTSLSLEPPGPPREPASG